jgi:glycosyltransferase involved in cell wall biosynthesis
MDEAHSGLPKGAVGARETDGVKSRSLAVFARMASRPIPRVARMMHVASESGMGTLFLAARREPGLATTDSWEGLRVERIGPEFALLNGTRAFTYVKSVLLYNFALFRALRRKRPSIVHASDIETMPGSTLYRLTSRTRLIYNIHDNVAQRYSIPAPARAVLNTIEGLFVRMSDVTIVPEVFRRDALPAWARSRVKVVRNTPRDLGRSPLPSTTGPIRIFFGGWLDWGRGLREILDLVARNDDLELVVAGEGSADIITQVKANPRTRFLGFVNHEQIMRESAASHVIPALYDPRRLINRYAASNKLAEALSLGRPVLLNSEMMIARDLAAYDCMIMVDYSAIRDAAPQLRSAVRDPQRFAAISANARAAYEALYSWDSAQAGMREALEGRQAQ